MKQRTYLTAIAAIVCLSTASHAAVTPQEAAQLTTTLTPFGAEKAGNREGTIPAWTGGIKSGPAVGSNGRRTDPFADDKKLFSITSKNVEEYSAKLTDGVKALLKKYPDSFRVDVYPTRRTASAPNWLYENTLKNATTGKMTEGQFPQNVFGGVPFPIPKTGAEVMWNSVLFWRGAAYQTGTQAFLGTSDGNIVMTVDGGIDQQFPYYDESYRDKFNGEWLQARVINYGPPIRAGEALLVRNNFDDSKTRGYVYVTGQRRVRRLPNLCCDTPSPASAGVMTFDEIGVFTGSLERFNWKIVGKKEIIVPYNTNRIMIPTKTSAVVQAHHLNPDHVRWELHRVWVVEATLAAGKRHAAKRNLYYIDEDTWMPLLGDRFDAKNELWRTLFSLPLAAPDLPGALQGPYGFYDLLAGTWFSSQHVNETKVQYNIRKALPESHFTPDALAGDGVR
ncbi:MAG: DUF1329 domain-containing protein [Pseudomonadota bacterium]